MARCEFCLFEMTTAASCTVGVLHRDGMPIPLARYGANRRPRQRMPERCGDCGVLMGGLHHPGCDMQRCPLCAGQFISCACWFDEDDLDGRYDDARGQGLLYDDWDDDDDDLDDRWAAPGSHQPLGVGRDGALVERALIGGVEVIIHHDHVPESDITTVQGIRCTTPLRTLIDLAPSTEPQHLREMVIDVLDRGLMTEDEAWQRLDQPDMQVRVGAEMLRQVLRSLR